MINKALLSFFILLSPFSMVHGDEDCKIMAADKVYHFGSNTSDDINVFEQSTCSNQVTKKVRELILNAKGPVQARALQRIVNHDARKNQNITISPNKIRVYNLSEQIQKRYGFNDKKLLKDFKFVDKGSLLLESNEILEFQCPDCQSTGEKSIKLTINRISSGASQTRWLKATSAIELEALTPLSTIRVGHNSLDFSDFKKTIIQTDEPEQFFTDPQDLKFYRLNRSLNSGEALKYSHVSSLNLVKIGSPVTVILKNKNLLLSHSATSLGSGKKGDTVKLRAQKSNKTLNAKVIDFNKVQIEL